MSNYCGFVGASLADVFYQFFGFSSWLFILGGLALAFKFFFNPLRTSFLSFVVLFVLFLVSFISIAELHFPNLLFFKQEVSLGGALGKLIVSVLMPLFHFTGTAVIVWSALALVVIFYSPISFSGVFSPWLWLGPKKGLVVFFRFLKKAPKYLTWAWPHTKGLFKSFLKALKTVTLFLKAKTLAFKKLFYKKKTPQKAMPSATQKPHFVFKEKDFLNQNKNPSSSEASLNSLEDENLKNSSSSGLKANDLPEEDSQSADLNSPSSGSTGLPNSQSASSSPVTSLDSSKLPSQKSDFADSASSPLGLNPPQDKPNLAKKMFMSFTLPSLDILSDPPVSPDKITKQEVENLSKKLKR